MSILKERRTLASIVILFIVFTSLSALARKKDKEKEKGQLLDSGVFSVYVNGKKVASETFEILQSPEMSIAKAELKVEDGGKPQKAELQLAPNGDLMRYTWSESGTGQAIVEPKDEFLVEKVTRSDTQKTAEQPFILPTSTSIMDDGFFSHRELLLWRYLGTQCHPKPNEPGCPLSPLQFGVIVPRQQMFMQVSFQYDGTQKVAIKGVDQALSRFELHTEAGDWTVWVDRSYKIQKFSMEAEHTEVVRE